MTGEPRVGVVTGEAAPELTDDGRAFCRALGDWGFEAAPLVWTDPTDWATVDVAVLRSCWGYHERVDDFRGWLATAAERAAVLNPPGAVRWNLHKFYLRDLADAGVPVVPTAFVGQGSDADLATVMAERGWAETVVKPAVGTSSAGVWRTGGSDADCERFASLLADGDHLVQQFRPEIADGERSFVFLGGEYSHAVRSVPATDDFRSHPSYGGTTEPFDPPADLVARAVDALSTARDVLGVDPADLPYARVDGVVRGGEFRLMELELIEPFLNLHTRDGAVDALAEAVVAALDRRRELA